MSAGIELDKLLSLALGTPEIGAVNFNVLHGVLAEIIKHLGVGKKVIEVKDEGNFKAAFGLLNGVSHAVNPTVRKANEEKWTYNEKRPISTSSLILSGSETQELEKKISNLESRLSVLDELPSNSDILKRAREKKEGRTPVADIWQFININRRLSATETAIEKLSSLLEHAISEFDAFKELEKELSKIKKSIADMEETSESFMKRLETLENSDSKDDAEKLKQVKKDLENLQVQVESLPTKKDIKDLDICVKWPQFESALKYGSFSLKSKNIHLENRVHGTNTENNLPNPQILDTIKQIGDICDGHNKVMNDIQDLQETMPLKADKEDLEEFRRRPDVPEDIIDQLNGLKTRMQNMINWKDDMINKGIDDLHNMKQSLKEFRENLEKLNISARNLAEEGNKKQKHIDKLYSISEDLQENKADKDTVSMEMDGKADKLALDNMISRMKFDASFGALDQSIQNILNRLSEQEAALQDAVSKLNNEVDGKLDRMEVDPLKDYINKRIKANKCKHVDLPVSDDSAAGMTKPLLKFHCISCARPVDVQPGMSAIPLPQYPGFPPSKSSRPYTPYELEQMRQHARGNYDGQENTSTRPCGGLHTMTYTTRRVNKSNQFYYKEGEGIIVPLREETSVQGNDGQLYKGRLNDLSEQLPTLQQQEQSQTSPKSPPKPPCVPSNPQTSPRSQTPMRPRSAVIR